MKTQENNNTRKRGISFVPSEEVYEELQNLSKKTGIPRTKILSRLVMFASKNPKMLYEQND